MPATRRASRSRLVTFYALLLTQTFSLIGSRMTAVAIGIWVFRETGQTAPLLLIAFFTELPGMVGGSLAGVLSTTPAAASAQTPAAVAGN